MRSTRNVVWVVGEPGVGKTTLVRSLLEPGSGLIHEGRVKWTVGPTVCAAGHYTGGKFDGADTVPYDGAKACLEFWRAALADRRFTYLDGDRFSNEKALEFFAAQDVNGVCLYLTAPEGVVQGRRAARGGAQNAAWVKGRGTKAQRFYERFGADQRVSVDASANPAVTRMRWDLWLAGT